LIRYVPIFGPPFRLAETRDREQRMGWTFHQMCRKS
jgi:hypothetical protein